MKKQKEACIGEGFRVQSGGFKETGRGSWIPENLALASVQLKGTRPCNGQINTEQRQDTMRKRFYLNKMADFSATTERHNPARLALAGGVGGAALSLRNSLPGGRKTPIVDEKAQIGHVPEFALPGGFYLGCKRAFDILISILALAIFALMLPLLALVIKLDSPGPVFYSQERVGINRRRGRRRGSERSGNDRRKVLHPGRPFMVHKLRTMGVNAEADGPQWARQNDMRVTRVGRFLRKTRLDEVPQFWNVLMGDMSLIGPRPERLVFVRQLEKDIPEYRDRLLILPGITGLAQVINGYDDGLESVRRKVELDRQYIRNAGISQDSRILFSTVGVVLKGDGAR